MPFYTYDVVFEALVDMLHRFQHMANVLGQALGDTVDSVRCQSDQWDDHAKSSSSGNTNMGQTVKGRKQFRRWQR